MKLKEIIQEYKNRHQLSNEEIAKQFHVTHTTVGRWLKGDIKQIQEETAKKMSEVLGYDVMAVLKGTTITLKKPILGMAKAGYDMFLDENYLGEENVTMEEDKDGDYFLQVVGDSMIHSGIKDGGLVYVKKCNLVNSGDIAVVAVDDEVTIKQLKIESDGIVLIASNPLVEDRSYSYQEVEEIPIKIMGRVLYSKNYM